MADSNRKRQSAPKSTGKGRTSSGTAKRGSTGTRRGQGKSTKAEQDMGFMRAEVVIICSFAVAVLLFLSNFRLCGVVGEALRGAQLGVFGMLGFLVPILLFVGTCFHMSNQGNIYAALKLGAVLLAILTICGLLQLMFGSVPEGAKWMEYYKQSATTGQGGGWLGGVLTSILVVALGRAGTYLVLFVALILCLVCITERSFVSVVKAGGGKAYSYAREDMDRRKEVHARRQEERRREREDLRLRGVNLDVTNLSDPRDLPDVMEESEELAAEREAIRSAAYDEAMEAMGTAAASADPAKKRKASVTADVFTGNIAMPPEYNDDEGHFDMDDVSVLADSIESHRRTGKKDPQDAYLLHNSEDPELAFQIPKDHRTLREMELGEGEPSKTAYGSSIQSEVPFDEDEPAGGFAPEKYTAEDYAAEGGDYEFPAEDDSSDYAREAALEFQPDEPDRGLIQEDGPEPTLDMEHEPEGTSGEDYVQEETPEGVNYDSFFVPEEPKRVVTASGKVFETETELLQKKLEKKRETAVQADVNVQVAQEIKQKEEVVKKEYIYPPTSLLKRSNRVAGAFAQNEYKATAIKLQQTLHNFGVGVTVTNISCGPAVTRYELLPEQGVKVSRIVGLTDDIKLSLAAADIRIEAPIPGKSAVGIEVPNKENNVVYLRELLESDNFKAHKSRLAFAVGKDIGGQVVVTDIAKMPHLLIAGATGSGKSVCINTLIMSIIFKSNPDDVKLIMVDPKVVERSVYNGIHHLLIPVVTDPKKASGALNWAVAEMTDRYKKFADCNVRDLKGYNERVEKIKDIEDDKKPSKLPQIVIIIDELADLMMVAPGEVEESICRLAQLARAAGIHLVIATQRPSVNVITGLIKANVPARIAFSVSSGVDSRTIIDMNGAEKLLGKGDMLFYPAGFPKPQRVQGAFVSDEEVGRVVDFLTEQGMTAQYSPDVESRIAAPAAENGGGSAGAGRDEYFVQAGQLIIDKDKASIGMLQRMFKIGFNRAARIMDQLAEAGVVGEEEGTKPRKVLMSPEEFEEFLEMGN